MIAGTTSAAPRDPAARGHRNKTGRFTGDTAPPTSRGSEVELPTARKAPLSRCFERDEGGAPGAYDAWKFSTFSPLGASRLSIGNISSAMLRHSRSPKWR